MLRICLFGRPKRRKQPERYATFAHKILDKKYFLKYHWFVMKNIYLLIFLLLFSSSFLFPNNSGECYVFQPGNYYMLDFPVNIRSQPNFQGEIIGKLYLNDEIEIIENARNPMEIDTIWSYWYKIMYNNKMGYIWGGYIAIERYACDIDNNGMMDYIFYRVSDVVQQKMWSIIDPAKDVIIYINNRRILANNLRLKDETWGRCEFSEGDDGIFIELSEPSSECVGAY
jgi:hypothetical protein